MFYSLKLWLLRKRLLLEFIEVTFEAILRIIYVYSLSEIIWLLKLIW